MKALLGLFEVSQVHQGGRGIGEDAVCPTVDQERKAELRQCKMHEKGGIMQYLFLLSKFGKFGTTLTFKPTTARQKNCLALSWPVVGRRLSPPHERASFNAHFSLHSLTRKKRPVKKEA